MQRECDFLKDLFFLKIETEKHVKIKKIFFKVFYLRLIFSFTAGKLEFTF